MILFSPSKEGAFLCSFCVCIPILFFFGLLYSFPSSTCSLLYEKLQDITSLQICIDMRLDSIIHLLFFFLLWLLGSKATKEHEIQETETGTLCLLSVVLCSSLLPRRPVQQYRRHGRVWLLAVGTDNLFHLRFFLQVRCWVRLVIFVEGLV